MSSPEDVEELVGDDLAMAYVRLRLARPELGMLEAALEAGYADRPGPLARKLFELALAAQEDPGAMLDAVEQELAQTNNSIERFKRRKRELEDWHRVLTSVTRNPSHA